MPSRLTTLMFPAGFKLGILLLGDIRKDNKQMANEDVIEGKLKQAEGKAQDAAGDVTGNTNDDVEGKAKQVEGKAQELFGKAKEAVHDATK